MSSIVKVNLETFSRGIMYNTPFESSAKIELPSIEKVEIQINFRMPMIQKEVSLEVQSLNGQHTIKVLSEDVVMSQIQYPSTLSLDRRGWSSRKITLYQSEE